MSNARSPRDVCSTTIGISGLIASRLLAAWGPDFHSRTTFLLLRSPKLLSGFRQVDGDSLHSGHHLVKRLAEPEVSANLLEIPALPQALRNLVGVLADMVGLITDELFDFLVAHFDVELVGNRVEDELTLERAIGLVLQAGDHLLLGLAGHRQIGLGRNAPLRERADERHPELGRPALDERLHSLYVRGGHQPIDSGLAELDLELAGELLVQARLDVATELGQGLELARGARKLVVEWRKHLLLDLLDRHLNRARPILVEGDLDRLRLPRRHSDEGLLDLVDEATHSDLSNVVELSRNSIALDVEDDGVAGLNRAAVDRRELGDGLPHALELEVHEVGRDRGLHRGNLELRPVGDVRLRQHGHRGREAEGIALGGQVLHLDLGARDGTDAGGLGRVPKPAGEGAAQNFLP